MAKMATGKKMGVGAKTVKPSVKRYAGGSAPKTNGVKGGTMGTAASIKVPNARAFNTKNMPLTMKGKDLNSKPDRMAPGKQGAAKGTVQNKKVSAVKQATAGTAAKPLAKSKKNYFGN